LVSPFVVLLDNHTTTRKGWKWENKPANWWGGYYADYLELNNYDIRLNPFYLFFGGYVIGGSVKSNGVEGYYQSSTAYSLEDSYRCAFKRNLEPGSNYRRHFGYPIRCLAR